MIWMDYNIESFPDGSFAVKGDWPGEVMGIAKDGSKKDNYLYKPGDVFIVNEYGILKKTDEVNALLLKHQTNKL
jgi:hypothetical protein